MNTFLIDKNKRGENNHLKEVKICIFLIDKSKNK